MEVTRKNFRELLPQVQESINKADFLAIDTEFTGLLNGRDVSMFDLPAEYYTTVLNGCTEFLLIQFGLCAFYWDKEQQIYKNDAYNFYLFPRGRPGPDKNFLCQSSSLDFLAAQGFDFNKLIKDGISYMNQATETRLRAQLKERQKHSYDKETVPIPEEHKQQIEDICTKVRQFLDNNEQEEIEIDRCNAFVRMLLFQELGTRFKKEAFVETKVMADKSRVLKVSRLTSPNQIKLKDVEKKEKEWEDFEDAVGFSKVARMISQSEKLVVGHNMLLDVIHTLNHFFQSLPADYGAFKEFAHCMFPKLLDTKYMSSLPPFKDKVNSSVLKHLLSTLSEEPFSLPKVDSQDGRGYSFSDGKAHEAGYDAFVTGLCFLSMASHVGRMRGERSGRIVLGAALKPFLNKLFLAKTAHQDSPYMNLAGADPNPSRDHVFLLTFPKEWQRNDINQLFSPYCAVTVQWVDDRRAIVALARRDAAPQVLRALAHHDTVTVTPYGQYREFDTDMQYSQSKLPMDRHRMELLLSVSSPELKSAQVRSAGKPANSPQTAPRRTRARCNSATQSPPPAPAPSRKRSSSGVFKIDEVEVPTKRTELARNLDNPRTRAEAKTNGRWKTSENAGTPEKPKEVREKAVVQTFASESKTKCVTAFAESDSWE